MPVPDKDTIQDDKLYKIKLTKPVPLPTGKKLIPKNVNWVTGAFLKTILDSVGDAEISST